jgi:hypothetical protein
VNLRRRNCASRVGHPKEAPFYMNANSLTSTPGIYLSTSLQAVVYLLREWLKKNG